MQVNNRYLIRFWFEFDFPEYPNSTIPMGTVRGCGISHFSLKLAVDLLKQEVFLGKELPSYTVKEGMDVSTLDPNHVLPNMRSPAEKGIWFPMGFRD